MFFFVFLICFSKLRCPYYRLRFREAVTLSGLVGLAILPSYVLTLAECGARPVVVRFIARVDGSER